MARHPHNHDKPEPEAHEAHEAHEGYATHHDSRFAELAAEVDALVVLMGQPGQTITQAQLEALARLDARVKALAGHAGPADASGSAPEAAGDPTAIPPAPEA